MTTSGTPGPRPGGHQDRSPTGSEDEPVPRDMAAAWRASEAQLYGSVVWDPPTYERAVLLVARVVEQLRRFGASSAALTAAGGSARSLVLEVAERDGVDLSSLDPTVVGQAALAMRLREVVDEQVRARRLSLLTAAAERGVPWVVLEESGDPRGDPFDPYQRLEVEVSTGRALSVTAAPDDTFTGVLHEVALLTVGLGDGRVGDAAPDAGGFGAPPSRHEDWVARERRADQERGGPRPR